MEMVKNKEVKIKVKGVERADLPYLVIDNDESRINKGVIDKEEHVMIYDVPSLSSYEAIYDKKKYKIKELEKSDHYELKRKKLSWKALSTFKKVITLIAISIPITIFAITHLHLFESNTVINGENNGVKNEVNNTVTSGEVNNTIINGDNNNVTNNIEHNTNIIDETPNWRISAMVNDQLDTGCLTCRKLISIDGKIFDIDLPRIAEIYPDNNAIISEINLYAFLENESIVLDLDSADPDDSGRHTQQIVDNEQKSHVMVGFLSTKPDSTYSTDIAKQIESSDKKETSEKLKKDKLSIRQIKKNQPFYVGFLQYYSGIAEPKIGINLLELVDNVGEATYYVLLSKYNDNYYSNEKDIKDRGNMKYKLLKLSSFNNGITSFKNFVYVEDPLTKSIEDEAIAAVPNGYTPSYNSAIPYYTPDGEQHLQNEYDNVIGEIEKIKLRREQ